MPIDTAGTEYSFPFGKYKGDWVCDIPTHYLTWVSENVPIENPHLLQAIKDELEFREAVGSHSRGIEDRAAWKIGDRQETQVEKVDLREVLKTVIQRWHLQGMRQTHPDKNVGLHRSVFQNFQKQAGNLRDMLKEIGIHVDLQL
jgi:hypothetical protein